MADLTELRDAEEEARAVYGRAESRFWEAAYGSPTIPQPLSTLLDAKKEALDALVAAVERRVRAEVAIEQVQEASEQLGAVIGDIKAMVESGPPPEGAAS